jgi:hypothetical protein
MADRQLVIAVFPDELAADNAAAALKESGIADGDAIEILALDSHGNSSRTRLAREARAKAPRSGVSCSSLALRSWASV